MAANFGPSKEGSKLYPGFTNTTPPGQSRLERLETGTQRFQRGTVRPTSGSYARFPKNLLLTKQNTTQILNLRTSAVQKKGSVGPASNTYGFAYVSTTTSITWYWDGTNASRVLVIHRADGSAFTVPTGRITITGLTANTNYYFLPFWNTNNLCNIGWVQGTVGAPQIAFVLADISDPVNGPQYLMEQNEQANEALSGGFMLASTPVSGGGGGGGGGSCVMSGTEIEPLGGLDYQIEVLPEFEWVQIKMEDSRVLTCTLDHPLYHAVTGKTDASELAEGDLLITDQGQMPIMSIRRIQRKCSKYKVMMPKGHLYWANGLLSHNQKIVPGV
jgi:hypothetical protein